MEPCWIPIKAPQEFSGADRGSFGKGIVFAPASGRSYLTLLTMFGDYKSRMGFICDNGCATYYREELVRIAEFERSEIRRILDMAFDLGGLYPGLCGLKGFYIQHRDESFLELVGRYFPHATIVDDLYEAVETDSFARYPVQTGST